VVIYSPSLNSMSWENADLCEYLASHGYVVIATPNFGATSRSLSVEDILGAKADATQGVEANAADIEFLIGYAHSLPYADTSRIAVAGFSWGGMANLLAAARDGRIRAMVELDTSFRYFPGLVESFADVHADQITIPMLYISHAEESQESIARRSMPSQIGPSVLNEWTHGDLVYVNMRALIHGEFSSMFQRNEFFWKNNYEPHKIPDYTREDGTVGYGWIARYVLEFLNSSICLDAKATDFLGRSPIENGAPANFMAVTYRKAVGNEPSMDSLRAEVGRQGFSDASEVYARMKKDAPGFAPRSSELVDWADELSALGRIAGSIEVRKLNIEVNPNAQGVYAALGDAYAQAGQQDLAAEYYRRQLQKTPRDLATQEKLARSVH
jgi:pimeloyl-ACP methyl ester carboxylesterase